MRAATAVARGVPVETGCGSFKVCALGLSFCTCEMPLGGSSSRSALTGPRKPKEPQRCGSERGWSYELWLDWEERTREKVDQAREAMTTVSAQRREGVRPPSTPLPRRGPHPE